MQNADHPRTLDGLQKARDMVEWRLEASAWELSLLLKERRAQQRCLAHLDELMRDLEAEEEGEEGEVKDEGEVSEKGEDSGEGDSEGEGEGEGEEEVDGSSCSTVAGSGTGYTPGFFEEQEIVDETLE